MPSKRSRRSRSVEAEDERRKDGFADPVARRGQDRQDELLRMPRQVRRAVRSGQGRHPHQREGQPGGPAQRRPHVRQGPFGDEDSLRSGTASLAVAPQGGARRGGVGAHHLGRGAELADRARAGAGGRVRRGDHRLRAGHRPRHEPVDRPRRQRRGARAPQPVAGKHLPGAHDGAGVSAVRHVPHLRRVRLRQCRLHRVLGRELRVDRADLHLGPDWAQPRPRGEAHRHRPVLRAPVGGEGRLLRGRAARFGHLRGRGVAQRHHERGSVRPRVHAQAHQRAHAADRRRQRAAECRPGAAGRQPAEHAGVRQEVGKLRGHPHAGHRRGHVLPRHGEAGGRKRGAGHHGVAGPEAAHRPLDAGEGLRDVLGPRRHDSRLGPHLRHRTRRHHQRVPGHRGADQLQGLAAAHQHHHLHLRKP